MGGASRVMRGTAPMPVVVVICGLEGRLMDAMGRNGRCGVCCAVRAVVRESSSGSRSRGLTKGRSTCPVTVC